MSGRRLRRVHAEILRCARAGKEAGQGDQADRLCARARHHWRRKILHFLHHKGGFSLRPGQNKLFVPDSGHYPLYFTDAPPPTVADKAARASTIASTALGPQRASSSPKDVATYRFLGSLGSHDLSAMRELIGLPKKCLVATRSRDGNFVNALFQYDGFVCSYETGIDAVKKFDAHIEVHGEGKRIKVTYDTFALLSSHLVCVADVLCPPRPFVKGLAIPVTVLSTDSAGQHTEATLLPTYIDTYTLQAERLYGCIVKGEACKTGPEDAVQDLEVFDSIMANLVQM